MTTQELIEKYRISRHREKLWVGNGDAVTQDGSLDEIKARKSEIIAFLEQIEAEQKRVAEERRAKINAIEGLKELQNAIHEAEAYQIAFSKFIENDGIGECPVKPSADIDALKQTYPAAAAYVLAESWYYSSHYVKSAAGKSALEQIINGEDCTAVIKSMQNNWSAYCEEHIWD